MFPWRPPAALAAWLGGAGGRGGLLGLLGRQCRFVTGLRVRRAQQIAQLYGRLYSESARRVLLGRLWRRLRGRPGQASALMSALAGVFVWEEERIQEAELRRWATGRREGKGREEGARGLLGIALGAFSSPFPSFLPPFPRGCFCSNPGWLLLLLLLLIRTAPGCQT